MIGPTATIEGASRLMGEDGSFLRPDHRSAARRPVDFNSLARTRSIPREAQREADTFVGGR